MIQYIDKMAYWRKIGLDKRRMSSDRERKYNAGAGGASACVQAAACSTVPMTAIIIYRLFEETGAKQKSHWQRIERGNLHGQGKTTA